VVGGGFIASEVTASLQKQYKNVSMLCDFNTPMERYFGYDVGNMLLGEHEKNGAKVYINVNVFKLKYVGDSDGKVTKVVLENGYEIPADLVVVGAGNIINTELP
jgi:3-phenylpropionate/trans-cinnamate dioxygenase ferredoxin reductase component